MRPKFKRNIQEVFENEGLLWQVRIPIRVWMKESSKAILFSNNIRDNLCGLCEITALVH